MLDSQTENCLSLLLRMADKNHVTRLILFGSRARGDHTEKSDVDIAVYGAENEALFNMDVDELDTLVKFDIVHISKDTSDELMQNIKRDGIVIMDKLVTKRNNFTSALSRLIEACAEYETGKNPIVRDGLIQRFEFTAELSWKATREHLLSEGYVDINSPKSVMKAAFTDGLIVDDLGWIELINARNITTHVYDEQQANQIAADIAQKFVPLFHALLEKLQ